MEVLFVVGTFCSALGIAGTALCNPDSHPDRPILPTLARGSFVLGMVFIVVSVMLGCAIPSFTAR